ncbi:MAG: transporter [Chloroflexi bacterium]|nr:transporter [Chloroflexota bacterium]
MPCRLGRWWDRTGDGPGEGRHLSGKGHDDLVGVLAPDDQLAIPLEQSHLRCPADGVDLSGQRLQPELEMPADPRRVLIGPGPFAERAPGVRGAGLGDAAVPSPGPRLGRRGGEAEVAHQLARGVGPGEVAQFGDHDDGARDVDAEQRLDRVDHRAQTPAGHVLVQRGLRALQPLVLLGDGAHVPLDDDPLRGGRTDDLMAVIEEIRDEGIAILLVEQNSTLALSIAHRAYLIDDGRIVHSACAVDPALTHRLQAV